MCVHTTALCCMCFQGVLKIPPLGEQLRAGSETREAATEMLRERMGTLHVHVRRRPVTSEVERSRCARRVTFDLLTMIIAKQEEAPKEKEAEPGCQLR